MMIAEQLNIKNEIFDLLDKEKRGEISYKELYLELQKYPADLKDRCVALYILEGTRNDAD
jgi:Ca2+-binding EF-hand superfamily protein